MTRNATTTCVRRRRIAVALGIAATLATASPALAQLNGENLLGDMGVKSGTQPEPGIYVSSIYYRYRTGSLKDAKGRSVDADPTGDASQAINAAVPLVYYVMPRKVLGAHFATMAVLPIANGGLEAPGLGLSQKASLGLSDLYVMPAQLGWRFRRADAVAGAAFFAPTGRYSAGASDNLGGRPADNPVSPQDYAATVYHALGIPPNTALMNRLGRPIELCDGKVISSLWGRG